MKKIVIAIDVALVQKYLQWWEQIKAGIAEKYLSLGASDLSIQFVVRIMNGEVKSGDGICRHKGAEW